MTDVIPTPTSSALAGCVTTGVGDSMEETGSASLDGGEVKEIDDGECKRFSFDVMGGRRCQN